MTRPDGTVEPSGNRSGEPDWRAEGWSLLDRHALLEAGMSPAAVDAAERAVLSGDRRRLPQSPPLELGWLIGPGAILLLAAAVRGLPLLLERWFYVSPMPQLDSVAVALAIGLGVLGVLGLLCGGVVDGRQYRRTWTAERSEQRRWIKEATSTVPLTDREGDLLARGLAAGEQAWGSAAWSSDFLQSHRLTVDLVEEARQLRYRTAKVHQLRRAAEQPGIDPTTAQLARDGLRISLDGVERRVTAMESYARHVAAVELQLQRLEELQRSEALAEGLTAQVNDLVALIAGDEAAADHLAALSQDARAVGEGLHEAIELVRDDLQALDHE